MTNSELRILVIDDNKEIHDDFRKVFAHAAGVHDDDLQDLQAEFFDDSTSRTPRAAPCRAVCIDSAFQGSDGVAMALKAAQEGRAHTLAFVDVRMPPGIDGVQTIKQLWDGLPELNCVLCTAFSDYDWEDIRQQLPHTSNLLILKKPFDPVEVLQVVEALAEKVDLAQASRAFHHSLERKIEELERAQRDLQQVNEQLVVARSEAEMAARAKADFLASMSHELRTPLNGVIAMTDMLLYTSLDVQQEKYVRTAKSSGEALLELINDILDFSRIESGKIELESTEFALHRELEAVITVVARNCQVKNLELACFVDPALLRPLRGDPSRMRQILTNLATNAVKFTERGEVVIEIIVRREAGPRVWVEFKVSDTGIGIPPERQHRLFNSFSQVDSSTTRKYGGTGLGLAISKQLCELMGGEISFSSTVGQGSVFRFVLPFEQVGTGDSWKSVLPPNFHGKRLLLVDDNRRICDILDRQLKAWGLHVETAKDLPSASSRLDEAKRVGNPFTAVLLDTGIGGPEAEKLPETLALFPELRHAPLILLIPLGQPGKLSSLLGNGVAGFVNKPIVPSDLFNVLMRLTTSARDTGVLPRSVPPRETQLLPVPKTRHAGARILLAEDNAINQKVATQILKCFGYEFDIVGDGSQAVQSLRNQPYNLVLMDCQMPEMDGLEATRSIRKLEAEGVIGKGGQIPIIALTANALEGDRQNCLEAGMTDYLSKPLRPEQLLQMIEKYLEEAFRLEQPADDAPADAETESGTDRCPAAPPFDLDVFVERCMGDRDFALQLLEELQTQFPGQLESLSVCLEEGALQDVVRLAHTFKGLAANVAADGLRDAAFQLEQAARLADFTAARQRMTTVRLEWDRLNAYLTDEFLLAAR